ncbi:MAG: hypothetical protein HY648_00610 [Acidobacteria bacterium]|nr:hypothetical protein [Acidobacteriota bacterium]
MSTRMPRYMSGHNIACLTRQGARDLAELMRSSPEARFLRFLVSLTEGQLIAEFEPSSREALEAWMKTARIHYDWMYRMDLEATREGSRDL